MSPSPFDVLKEAVAAWNLGDLDRYLALYAADVRIHGYGPEPLDKAGATEFYKSVWATLAAEGRIGPELRVIDTLIDGKRLACRFSMSGIQSGPFMETPARGKAYELTGVTILHFKDGAVVERWSATDLLPFALQIGAVVPKPPESLEVPADTEDSSSAPTIITSA